VPRSRRTSGIAYTEGQWARDPLKGRLIGSHRFRSYNEPGSNPRRFGGDATPPPHSPRVPRRPFFASPSRHPYQLSPSRPLDPFIYLPHRRRIPRCRSLGNSLPVSRALVPRQSWFSAATASGRRALPRMPTAPFGEQHLPRRDSIFTAGKLYKLAETFPVFFPRTDLAFPPFLANCSLLAEVGCLEPHKRIEIVR